MPTPPAEPAERADCPQCGYPGLRRTNSGLMFPHRVKGARRNKVCEASEVIQQPTWQRHK